MGNFDLSGYNTVPERIIEFRAKYPDGTLQRVGPLEVFELGGTTFIAYTAAAFRTPDDARPGIGTAWEPVPGLTRYTKNSELQNCETSAWGRAIIAVGAADANKGIASREDVQNRQAESDYYSSPEYAEQQAAAVPVPGFRSSLMAATDALSEPERALLRSWLVEQGLPDRPSKMDAEQADRVCVYLMHGLPKVDAEPAEVGA